ncbi:MAG: metal ABC transporter ATP-binding protein [Candidatus Roizmanbacteria bacterium]
MNNSSAIQSKNLTVEFDTKVIISDLTLSIPYRSITVIIGPNGSGKSTLLKALLGLVPYSGSITLFEGDMLNLNIGYVPQHTEFDRTIPMTVFDLLRLSLYQKSPKNQLQSITEALKELDIEDLAQKPLRELSGGQFQRVLIARAIQDEPKLLILDEASAGIDYVGVKGLHEVLKHLKEIHNTTILMVSHEINIIPEIADRVICLGHGYSYCGEATNALTQEHIIRLFSEKVKWHDHHS